MKLPNAVRYLNKYGINRLTGLIARWGWGPFALVRHVGRRSGRQYSTPIMVAPCDGTFVIALTYGPRVDWYRNVLAAGQCTIVWHRQEYAITTIQPLDAATGLPAFPRLERTILRAVGIEDFVRMG